ncbi:COG0603 Predicted PP-loop superfamily ATPase, partial [uncultured Caudovirales phage]
MTAFVSLSGGLDSSIGLALAVAGHGEQNVVAVSFDYGQRHLRELESARQVAAHLNVEHRIVDLKGMLTGSALLGEGDVPLGHYAADSMSVTVVHGRNLLFVSTIVAMTRPGDEVWLSVHSGDHYVYPDCRPEFVRPLQALLFDAYEVTLRA